MERQTLTDAEEGIAGVLADRFGLEIPPIEVRDLALEKLSRLGRLGAQHRFSTVLAQLGE